MGNNQLELLHGLKSTLDEMSRECEYDDDFNELVASMKIFSRSLDEASDIVDEVLDNIHGE